MFPSAPKSAWPRVSTNPKACQFKKQIKVQRQTSLKFSTNTSMIPEANDGQQGAWFARLYGACYFFPWPLVYHIGSAVLFLKPWHQPVLWLFSVKEDLQEQRTLFLNVFEYIHLFVCNNTLTFDSSLFFISILLLIEDIVPNYSFDPTVALHL